MQDRLVVCPPQTTSVEGGPGSRVRLCLSLPVIEGGRSSDWGGDLLSGRGGMEMEEEGG